MFKISVKQTFEISHREIGAKFIYCDPVDQGSLLNSIVNYVECSSTHVTREQAVSKCVEKLEPELNDNTIEFMRQLVEARQGRHGAVE